MKQASLGLKLIFSLFLMVIFSLKLFAQGTANNINPLNNASGGSVESKGIPTSNEQLAELRKVFAEPTYYDRNGNLVYGDSVVQNGACSWKCRKVTGIYATRATGYDFVSGTTYCEIIDKNDYRKKAKYNANQTNFTCANEWKKRDSSAEFATLDKSKQKVLAYFIIPGAGTIYDVLYKNIKPFADPLMTVISFGTTIIPGGKFLTSAIMDSLGKALLLPTLALWGMSIIVNTMLKNVPVLVAMVAAAIACVSYLVSLCKYFYIL